MATTQENTHPIKVKLIAIRSELLHNDNGIRDYNRKINFEAPNEFMVFTCATRDNAINIFKPAKFITQASGYEQCEVRYKEIAIPEIHEKQSYKKNKSREFTPAIAVTALDEDKLRDKFPNAEVIIVKSVDELRKVYEKATTHNQKIVDEENEKIEKKLGGIKTTEIKAARLLKHNKSSSVPTPIERH